MGRRRKSRGRKGGLRSLQNPFSSSKGSVKNSLEGGRQEAENNHGAPCPHHRQQKGEAEAELPMMDQPKAQGPRERESQGMRQDRPAPELKRLRTAEGQTEVS